MSTPPSKRPTGARAPTNATTTSPGAESGVRKLPTAPTEDVSLSDDRRTSRLERLYSVLPPPAEPEQRHVHTRMASTPVSAMKRAVGSRPSRAPSRSATVDETSIAPGTSIQWTDLRARNDSPVNEEVGGTASTQYGPVHAPPAPAFATSHSRDTSGASTSTTATVSTNTGRPSRWATIRHAVLPAASPDPTSPNAVGTPKSPSSSFRSQQQPAKPSRFGRGKQLVGFKQVVEHARETVVTEDRKFADEVVNACLSSRLGARRGGATDGASGTGRTFGTGSAAGSTVNLTTTAKKAALDIAKRQSRVSLVDSGTASLPSSSMSNVATLQYVLVRRASAGHLMPATHLPHEVLVLSTLLSPYIGQSNGEDDKRIALETLEIIVRTWEPLTNDVC